jgi:hypothetical protein
MEFVDFVRLSVNCLLQSTHHISSFLSSRLSSATLKNFSVSLAVALFFSSQVEMARLSFAMLAIAASLSLPSVSAQYYELYDDFDTLGLEQQQMGAAVDAQLAQIMQQKGQQQPQAYTQPQQEMYAQPQQQPQAYAPQQQQPQTIKIPVLQQYQQPQAYMQPQQPLMQQQDMQQPPMQQPQEMQQPQPFPSQGASKPSEFPANISSK